MMKFIAVWERLFSCIPAFPHSQQTRDSALWRSLPFINWLVVVWSPSIWHFPRNIGNGLIIPIDEVIFFPINIGNGIIIPIDEVHHFSGRGGPTNHQPDQRFQETVMSSPSGQPILKAPGFLKPGWWSPKIPFTRKGG